MLCRTSLGFWAGHRNSKIRVILARVWENDTELDISNNRISRATGHLVYQKRFYRSKFCICPGGSQVNSARIADSIHYGCIPGKSYFLVFYNLLFFWLLILSFSKLHAYMTMQWKKILPNCSISKSLIPSLSSLFLLRVYQHLWKLIVSFIRWRDEAWFLKRYNLGF